MLTNEQLYLGFIDSQEFLADQFSLMSIDEFHSFLDFTMERINEAFDIVDRREMDRIKSLIFSIAWKCLEMSFFLDYLTDEQRVASRNQGIALYELAKGFYPEEKQKSVEDAWIASLDYGTRFGYPSPVASILAPHQVFRED